MSDQRREFQAFLTARIALIQALSAANSEGQRLNQIASGLMILDQKDGAEGGESEARSPERRANAQAADDCRTRIAALERQLAALDRDLATSAEGNGR